MIEVAGLGRRFGAVDALRNLSFSVAAGEIVGFLGPNGAGKTTAMRILTCTLPPTTGRASVAGHDVVAESMAVRRRVGFMPENVPLYGDCTVAEQLRLVARLKQVPARAVAAAVDGVVERAVLGDVRSRLVGHLSKGYRQRVGLAQALLGDPPVLILDEPSGGLDPQQIVEIRELIRGFAGEKTVLLSSHILNEVSLICGRVLILDRGRLVGEADPHGLAGRADGRPRVVVAWDGPREPVRAALAALPGVGAVEPAPEGAVVTLTGDAEAIRPEIAAAVIAAGGRLQRMEDRAATLEDLFLRLTATGAVPAPDAEGGVVSQAWAIARREIAAFFGSAMAPIVIVAFLVLAGLTFMQVAFDYSQLSSEAQRSGRLAEVSLNLAEGIFLPLAMSVLFFLLFLLPAVTMRLFAEEYRSGRYDLIMTYPVADHTWVLGKFAGGLAVAATLVLGTALHVVIAGALGRIEAGPLLAAGLGLLLTAAVNVGWGVFFSSLLPYQVVAYILTFGFLLLIYSVGALEPHLPAVLGRGAEALSLKTHFVRLASGRVDSRDLYYMVAMTTLALFAASASLGGRRLAGARRWARWSPVAALTALLIVGGLIGERHAVTSDWTRNRRYSLSPQTVQILRELRADVRAVAFYQRLDPRRKEAEDLLRACADRSPRFRFEIVDPDRDLAVARQYGVTAAATVVVEGQGRRRALFNPAEPALVNAVYRLVTATQPVVYYVVGHGEHRLDSEDRGGYSALTAAVTAQGYELRQLLLADEPIVPPDAAVVVLAAPKTDLGAGEIEALRRYVRAGGSLLALLDAGTPRGVAAWLTDYNVILGNDSVVIASGAGQGLGFDPRVAVVDSYGDHEITRALQGTATFFPFAQSLQPVRPGGRRGLDARTILSTGPRSWADRDSTAVASGKPRYDEGIDRPGPVAIGVAMEADRAVYFAEGGGPAAPAASADGGPAADAGRTSVFTRAATARLVVIGDSDFAANANLDLYGNRDLALNTLSWLAREQALIALRPRDHLSQPRVLSAGERRLIVWGCAVGWPLLAGAASAFLLIRRRRAR